MKRLSGLDANFLYNETPTEHMHTLKLAVLDPPPGDQLPWELIRGEIATRMLSWPAFSRKGCNRRTDEETRGAGSQSRVARLRHYLFLFLRASE